MRACRVILKYQKLFETFTSNPREWCRSRKAPCPARVRTWIRRAGWAPPARRLAWRTRLSPAGWGECNPTRWGLCVFRDNKKRKRDMRNLQRAVAYRGSWAHYVAKSIFERAKLSERAPAAALFKANLPTFFCNALSARTPQRNSRGWCDFESWNFGWNILRVVC